MKALKTVGACVAIPLIGLALGVYVIGGGLTLYARDVLRARARRLSDRLNGRPVYDPGPKIYPAIPGLVMDADGFVEPLAERQSRQTGPGAFGVINGGLSVAEEHARQSVLVSPGDEDFARGLLAFPADAGERRRLKEARDARNSAAETPLPANVLRLADFRKKR